MLYREPLVSAVTVGSVSNTLNRRWLADLIQVPIILAAYDRDEAGHKGAARLRALSQRVHLVQIPWGKDLTEYHLDGGEIFTWLARELRRVRELTMPVTQAGRV